MPDPAAAPLALAPAAQRTEWLDVVVPEGVEAERSSASRTAVCCARLSLALRVPRHTGLISAAEVTEGPQLYRVPCTLPFYYLYTIL